MSAVIDFAWQRPGAAALAGKVSGVIRYLSHDPTKDITPKEYASYLAHSIPVGIVWETTARRALDGWQAGHDDAVLATERARHITGADGPIYFAVDFDATALQASNICSNYLAGAHAALGYGTAGHPRTGVYGGWKIIDAAHRAGFHYLWQTVAWSNNVWHPAALLAQSGQAEYDGIRVDIDYARAADWGQYPRPTVTPSYPAWPGRILRLTTPPMRGNDISTLQRQLATRGWNCPVNGVYDQHTRNVVCAFQRDKGYTVDGEAGVITWTGAFTAPIT